MEFLPRLCCQTRPKQQQQDHALSIIRANSVAKPSPPVPDFLDGFLRETIEVYEGDEGSPVPATLISKTCYVPSTKAILHIHSYLDYFHHEHYAEEFLVAGWNFYAIDLRRHGRSLSPGQPPQFCRDLEDYYQELDMAVHLIKDRDHNTSLVLSGHSTGALLCALYATDRARTDAVQGLLLTSPVLDVRAANMMAKTVVHTVGGGGAWLAPFFLAPGDDPNSTAALHQDFKGEWAYNLHWKPPVGESEQKSAWLSAVISAQARVRELLHIACPVLVLHSAESGGNAGEDVWDQDYWRTDTLIDVADVVYYADYLGETVKRMAIKDGMHDLLLSSRDVRNDVIQKLIAFANDITPS